MGKDLTDLFIEQIMWFPGVQETQGEMFGERSFRNRGQGISPHPRAFDCACPGFDGGQVRGYGARVGSSTPLRSTKRHGGIAPAQGGPAPGGARIGQAILRLHTP